MAVTGIDVSKALWDVSIAEGPVYRFENSGSGNPPLAATGARAGATLAVCECPRRVGKATQDRAGITVQVAHSLRVRAFARLWLRGERPTPWMPGCSRAMAKCSRRQQLVD